VRTATVVIRYAGLTIPTDPNFLNAGDHGEEVYLRFKVRPLLQGLYFERQAL
jgi:hypothetical protein